MDASVSRSPLDRFSAPDRREITIFGLFVNLQLVFVVLYYATGMGHLTDPRYLLYGLLWVNVASYVIYRTSPPSGVSFAARRRALALVTGYFGVLAVVGGLVATGVPEAAPGGVRIAWLTPGWGPALVYGGEWITLTLTPAYLLGYLALSYLVYVTILEASGSSVAGLLGLLSCVSCTWPVVAGIGGALFGGGGLLAATALESSYDLSTAVFLLTVAILYFRPGFR